jgi:hypothetical protein
MATTTEIEKLKRDIASLESAMQPKTYATPEEKQQFGLVEYRADQVLAEFGKTVTKLEDPPRGGESLFDYRKRVAQRVGAETRKYRSRDISSLPPAEFLPVEAEIFADALKQARHPLDLGPTQFREVKKIDRSGRAITEFVCGEGPGAFRALYAQFIAKPMVQEGGLFVNGVEKHPRVMPT